MIVGLFRFDIARQPYAANHSRPTRHEWLREARASCPPKPVTPVA